MYFFFYNKRWVVPEYSKSQINNAGRIIATIDDKTDEKEEAMKILNNWRSSHAYPLHVIASNLRRNNKNALVVQRLKRLDSISNKLKRYPSMSLYRMQDLGGCRVIVDTIDDVYKTLEQYKNSRIRHEFKKEDDYINNPKESGYRSYHMVYKFHSETKDTYNKNILIEIQFRTQLQHVWATAVEMMGLYTGTDLKAGFGDDNILRFFKLVSSVFALKEKMPVIPNTSNNLNELIAEVKELNIKYNILPTLSALKVAQGRIQQTKLKSGYHVLILNYNTRMLRIKSYPASKLNDAFDVYAKIESEEDPHINVVLVSAQSFDALRMAYPNYFTDITAFIKTVEQTINVSNNHKPC